MFNNKKANFGATLFIGLLLFNIVMYILVSSANADPNFDSIGAGTLPEGDPSISSSSGWFDGFRISIWGLPEWLDYLYVTFQGILIILSLYMLGRGMN